MTRRRSQKMSSQTPKSKKLPLSPLKKMEMELEAKRLYEELKRTKEKEAAEAIKRAAGDLELSDSSSSSSSASEYIDAESVTSDEDNNSNFMNEQPTTSAKAAKKANKTRRDGAFNFPPLPPPPSPTGRCGRCLAPSSPPPPTWDECYDAAIRSEAQAEYCSGDYQERCVHREHNSAKRLKRNPENEEVKMTINIQQSASNDRNPSEVKDEETIFYCSELMSTFDIKNTTRAIETVERVARARPKMLTELRSNVPLLMTLSTHFLKMIPKLGSFEVALHITNKLLTWSSIRDRHILNLAKIFCSCKKGELCYFGLAEKDITPPSNDPKYIAKKLKEKEDLDIRILEYYLHEMGLVKVGEILPGVGVDVEVKEEIQEEDCFSADNVTEDWLYVNRNRLPTMTGIHKPNGRLDYEKLREKIKRCARSGIFALREDDNKITINQETVGNKVEEDLNSLSDADLDNLLKLKLKKLARLGGIIMSDAGNYTVPPNPQLTIAGPIPIRPEVKKYCIDNNDIFQATWSKASTSIQASTSKSPPKPISPVLPKGKRFFEKPLGDDFEKDRRQQSQKKTENKGTKSQKLKGNEENNKRDEKPPIAMEKKGTQRLPEECINKKQPKVAIGNMSIQKPGGGGDDHKREENSEKAKNVDKKRPEMRLPCGSKNIRKPGDDDKREDRNIDVNDEGEGMKLPGLKGKWKVAKGIKISAKILAEIKKGMLRVQEPPEKRDELELDEEGRVWWEEPLLDKVNEHISQNGLQAKSKKVVERENRFGVCEDGVEQVLALEKKAIEKPDGDQDDRIPEIAQPEVEAAEVDPDEFSIEIFYRVTEDEDENTEEEVIEDDEDEEEEDDSEDDDDDEEDGDEESASDDDSDSEDQDEQQQPAE